MGGWCGSDLDTAVRISPAPPRGDNQKTTAGLRKVETGRQACFREAAGYFCTGRSSLYSVTVATPLRNVFCWP